MQSLNVTDYVKVKQVLSEEYCKTLLHKINQNKWHTKPWFKSHDKNVSKVETLVQACMLDPIIESEILLEVNKGLFWYTNQLYNGSNQLTSGLLRCMINKYETGVSLEKHFDQSPKESTAITCIILLNNEFTGGDLIFFDNHHIKLKVGEAVYFPSNFIFTHQVTKVESGTRYSFSAWFK